MLYLNNFIKFNESKEVDLQSYLEQGMNEGNDYCKLLLILNNQDEVIKEFGGSIESAIKQIKHNSQELDGIKPEIKELFLNIQSDFKKPLKIEYGFRTREENRKVGGANNSAHLFGLAFDIYFDKPNKEDMIELVRFGSRHGALGIGVYRDQMHIHFDIDKSKGRRSWSSGYTSGTIPDWVKPIISEHLSKKLLQPYTPNYWDKPIPTTETKSNSFDNWQPKSGVVFLPTEGKGTPSKESKESFFGKQNYPWIGLPTGVKRDMSKPLQYISISSKDFEDTYESIIDGKADFLRPYTIIIVCWNETKNQQAINDDLKVIMNHLKVNKIDKITNEDLDNLKVSIG